MALYKDNGTRGIKLDVDGDSYITGGDLGIGTTAPAAKAHIVGSLRIDDNTVDGNLIYCYSTIIDDHVFIVQQDASGNATLVLYKGGSAGIRLEANGDSYFRGGRVTVRKSSNSEITALTDASTVALDFDDANNFTLLTTSGVGSTRALGNPSNLTAGQSGAIVITSDAADRLITYSSYWDFEGGTAPSLTTTSGGIDTLLYYVSSTTSIHAVLLKDMK
jgi:hypothetical protein